MLVHGFTCLSVVGFEFKLVWVCLEKEKRKEIGKEETQPSFSNPAQPRQPKPAQAAPSPRPSSHTNDGPIQRRPDHPAPTDPRWTPRIRSRVPVLSEPRDPDPADQICVYPFALAILLKSPSIPLKSTCSLSTLKSNCRSAQFLAF